MKFIMLHSVYWTGVLKVVRSVSRLVGYIICETSWKHFSSYATERNYKEKETTASWSKPTQVTKHIPVFTKEVSSPYLSQSLESCVKSFSKMPVNDGGKYTGQSIVIKLINGDDIKVSCEASSDVITTSTRWPHSRDK